MKLSLLLVLVYYVTFLKAALPTECPTIENYIKNFNASEYVGKWYEIQRLNNTLIDEDCGEPIYTLDSGKYKVEYLMRDTSSNTPRIINMVLEPFGNESAYNILINGTKNEIPHIVLETDYTSYSVVWGCVKEHGQRLFIYSRAPTLNATHNATITTLLNKLSITEELITVEQDKIKCNRNGGNRIYPTFGSALLIYLISKFM